MASRIEVSALLRFTLYTFAVVVLAAALPALVENFGIAIFTENGPIEWLQFGLMVAASAVFFAGAALVPHFRRLLVLLACVPVALGFRELDALLDELVPWIGWKIAFAVVLYLVLSARANKRILESQLPPFFMTRAFAILWCGFLVAFPIAQLVGHGPFLQAAMGDDYVYAYKQMIEEILELMGYVLLLIGAVESTVQLGSAYPGTAPAPEAADKGAARSLPAPSPARLGVSLPAASAALVRHARKSLAARAYISRPRKEHAGAGWRSAWRRVRTAPDRPNEAPHDPRGT